MSAELSAKLQITLWWITSLATSILCCAVLFVLFAGYLVDVKGAIKENDERISIIQEREDRILAEIEMIRKHAVFQTNKPAATVQAPVGAPPATEAPVSLSVSGANPNKTPDASPAEVPAVPVSPNKK